LFIKRYYFERVLFQLYIKAYIPIKNLYIRIFIKLYYKISSLKKSYLQFQEAKWVKLSNLEKRVVIQNIENKAAKKQHRKNIKIKLVDAIEEDLYTIVLGKYYTKRKVIEIAIKEINPLIILKTYFHEQKHVIQHSLSISQTNNKFFEKCLSMIQYEGYIYLYNEKKYVLQKLELDANFYSIENILKLEYIYKDENNWINLLKYNNFYIDNILELEKVNSKSIKDLIYYNINKADDLLVLPNADYKKVLNKIKYTTININSSYNYIINLNRELLKKYTLTS